MTKTRERDIKMRITVNRATYDKNPHTHHLKVHKKVLVKVFGKERAKRADLESSGAFGPLESKYDRDSIWSYVYPIKFGGKIERFVSTARLAKNNKNKIVYTFTREYFMPEYKL